MQKFEGKTNKIMISAILLGAGESKRMGVDKLSLPWGRKTVLEHCFGILSRSNVQELVIVLNIRNKEINHLFQGENVKVVMNPYFKRGMSTSIKRGLQAIHTNSHGILIALGDQPYLKTRTVNALIRTFNQGRGGIIIPSFQGKRGHPIIFHKKYKEELLDLKGDVGGKSVIERHLEDIRVVTIRSEGVIKDIDTLQDYEKGFFRRSQS